MRIVVFVAVACSIFVGCAAQQQMMWVRVDGASGAAVAQQFELDKLACEGEMQKANLSGSSYCRGLADCIGTSIARGSAMQTVGKGCMASKGYVMRPVPEVVTASAGPGPGNVTAAYEPQN